MTAAVVVSRLLEQSLSIAVTPIQADHLWSEFRNLLLGDMRLATIVCVENDPGLEVFVPFAQQQDLLSVVGKVFADSPWPRENDPPSVLQTFLDRVATEMAARNYQLAGKLEAATVGPALASQ